MQRFSFPTGPKIALQDADIALSFDQIHALRQALQLAIHSYFGEYPARIVGCLEDSIRSVMALLACTEITDYMPINPRLREAEILNLALRGDAKAAILSASNVAVLGPMLQANGLRIACWDDLFDAAIAQVLAAPAGGQSDVALAAAHIPQQSRLILHTSGTTGSPKRVPLQIDAMMQSSRNIAQGHGLQHDDLALNTLPTFHIGALVDVLLAPFSVQGSVAMTADRSAAGILRAARKFRPTWVQLVPTLLLHLVDDLGAEELRDLGSSLRFIRNISAPVPDRLRARAENALGCPIIEMYGMTEMSGQICTNGRAAQDRRAGTVGRPSAVPVTLLDETGNPVPQGKMGEICVSGPTVFAGYEGVDRSATFIDDWFRTGDIGLIDADGFLSIKGRLKEMINIGGEKVSPSEIEAVALAHPNVKEAAAYALPHDSLGEVSGLTLAVKKPIDQSELHALLLQSLADFKMPRRIRQIEVLPRLPNAKVDRMQIARDALADMTQSKSEPAVPQVISNDRLQGLVAGLWASALKSRPPQGDDDFFDMGGDSLSATEFLMDLSQRLGRQVPPNQLFETPRFADFIAALDQGDTALPQMRPRAVEFVARKMAGWKGQVVLPNGLFRGFGTVKNGTKVFWACQAMSEVGLAQRHIGARRPFYSVSSLYRFDRDPLARGAKRDEQDFRDLAQHLAAEIQIIQPEGMICLGGFCGGAGVMHHVADALMAKGRSIKLFISQDFWPTRPFEFPVLHAMSESLRHSARVFLHDYASALQVLHPKGCEVHPVQGGHLWTEASYESIAARLDILFDAAVIDMPMPAPQGGSFADRNCPVSAHLDMVSFPRFYRPSDIATFRMRLRNMSGTAWQAFDQSGLAVEVKLLNIDGYTRDAHAGFAPLLHPVGPGETALVEGQIRLPNRSVPLICVARFQSHGLAVIDSKKAAQNAPYRLLLPRF